MIDYEFYQTPRAFTRFLLDAMMDRVPIVGRVYEPCVGNGAIVAEAPNLNWLTNDLDPRWPADSHHDATTWWPDEAIDWTVSNPPFTPALDIIERALANSRVGVAMHLRASIHEVLKTGRRRTWMANSQPTGILWLPRFAYQRSKKTGEWATDNVCACWVIWLTDPTAPQFIDYAPESVIDALDAETPGYRRRMDRLMAERNAA